MKKIILSISMLKGGLNEAINNNVEFLCAEFGINFKDVVSRAMASPKIEEINRVLEEFFPGQIKIIE